MKKLMYLIIVPALLTQLGCESLMPLDGTISKTDASATTENAVREQIEQADEIQKATGEISQVLDEIDGEAKNILNEVALAEKITESLIRIEESAEEIREQVDNAQLEQVRIEESLEDLEQANMRIAAAVGEIAGLEDLIEDYEQSDREVRKEALENLHSFITLFFVIGFGMLIGGAFLTFWVNRKLGGVVLAIGVLTVGFASASQYYLEEIATIGLIVLIVGFLASLGVVGWMLIDGRNNKKAIEEIVELIEETKDHLTPEERQEIFGRDGFASHMTSDLTKKIVSQVKIKNGFKNLSRNKK